MTQSFNHRCMCFEHQFMDTLDIFKDICKFPRKIWFYRVGQLFKLLINYSQLVNHLLTSFFPCFLVSSLFPEN